MPPTHSEHGIRSIDIHAHLTPQCFWQATANGGDWHTLRREQDARGREYAIVGQARQPLPPRARWTPEARLADMDSLGVDVHVLSPYSGFYNYHLDASVAIATSQDSNNEIHAMVTQWPERFAGTGHAAYARRQSRHCRVGTRHDASGFQRCHDR